MLLRNGSISRSVRQLQKDLLELGYSLPSFGADGSYGNETVNAVRELQNNYNLTVDGMAGPETLATIKTLLTEETELYRVQVGAFTTKQRAKKMEDKLKAAGFETYLVKG
ncbi:peptidoglycan-binding protein [Salipaludibacillus aurantiacus]|uniref:Sporulation related domain-containing protein n=1 Tax=Salipaludibacillus aurantiacus TaxID=1601833 RepID=A0A1H9WZ23_9BACI|nr:peptidoglycan-binding protein [Salipaludibacillus aurantiacus]SES39208.1 Sporulation related domain-containing protein [Salipaludibacillus aurantiacus]